MHRLLEAQGNPPYRHVWVEPTGKWLERPFSVARWIEGEADLTKLAEAANLEQILEQYIEILARITTSTSTARASTSSARPPPRRRRSSSGSV
jgi:aminoglycoside phosphotransferase (APT) family kinase protein